MKTTFLKYFLGLSLLACFVLALVFDYSFNKSDRLSTLTKKTQKIFLQKERKLDESLLFLNRAIEGKKEIRHKYKDFSQFDEDLKKKGIALLAFEKDSLIFWNDNSFSIPTKEYIDSLKSQLVDFDNGSYYIKKIEKDSSLLVGLLLIKKKFPYQNKFLKNQFASGFNIPNSVELGFEQNSEHCIFNQKGDFLYSLQKSEYENGMRSGLKLIGILYGMSLLFGMFFLSVLFRGIKIFRLGFLVLLLVGVSIILARYFMLLENVPEVFSNLELFSPVLFANSFFYPSLGDFTINSFLLFVFVYTYSRFWKNNQVLHSITRLHILLWLLLHLFLFYALFYWLSEQFLSLILDSSFSFQMFVFQEDGEFVFVGFAILLFLFYSLGMLANLIGELAKVYWTQKVYFAIVLPFSLVLSACFLYLKPTEVDIVNWIFPIVILFVFGLISYRKDKSGKYSLYVILLLIVSIFVTNRINVYSQQKERQDRLVAAMNLSTEYDPTSETLLVDLQKRLNVDTDLQNLCKQPFKNEVLIMDYIQDKYFTGYWEQYNLQITICNVLDDLNIEPDNQIRNCFEFFEEMILKNGEPIPNTNFYYLNEFDGMVSYLGIVSTISPHVGEVRIYLRLDSKIGNEGLGYPDLLLDEKLDLRPAGNLYSYGKYQNGKLIASSGKFNYFLNEAGFGEHTDKNFWIELDGYNHLVYKSDSNAVVVSTPSVTWYNKVVTIPYVFVFFYVFGFLIWLFEHYPWKFRFVLSFKYRIQYSLIGLLMLFFLLIGGGTVYYNINQANESNSQKLHEKLLLVKREVIHNFTTKGQNNIEDLTDRLRQLSNLIYADIHLYNLSGNLIASSRPEIFEKKLQGEKMNFTAFYQLFFKERTHFIHNEEIGEMKYLSAYETLIDENNKTIAYLNLPYFLRSQELQKEMFNLILAGVNLHVLMILLAIILSVIISNKITYPLRLIQNKLKATRFGTHSEQIEYSKSDEIGSLVKEYNQMLLELEESANRLARSERESAWREMARQIAHEIKNPLTPMKLSIQFLQKRFEEQSENREEHFNRVSKTLIEQINALSSIATAFSNFAQMPLAKNERLNMVEILNHVISLFKNDDFNLRLELNGIEQAEVFVDREQFVRVFVNLINNAIQSVPDNRKVEVNLVLEKTERNYQIKVIDNGIGINQEVMEKLFSPNFTTKSGGMGLGLAIVKRIIENANGRIWVESKVESGSCFFIQIPKY